MKIQIKHFKLSLLLLAMVIGANKNILFSQACSGNQLTITLSNPKAYVAYPSGGKGFQFDVLVNNTGSTTIKLSALTLGFTYTAGTFAGGTAGFSNDVTVGTPPAMNAANEVTGLAGITFSHTAAQQGVNYFRAVQNPIGSSAASFTLPSGTSLKYATFLAQCPTCPWTQASMSNLTLQATNVGAAQASAAVVYCNGNPSSTTLNSAGGTLVLNSSATQAMFLPLELRDFDGEVMDGYNRLFWETESERNIATHIVERSVEGTSWIEVGRVKGEINSNTLKPYEVLDMAPVTKAFYRLRSVELDGSSIISKTILITRTDKPEVVNIFPSPTSGPVILSFEATEEKQVDVMLFDLNGRSILEQSFTLVKGLNSIPVDLSEFEAGIYTVKLRDGINLLPSMQLVKY